MFRNSSLLFQENTAYARYTEGGVQLRPKTMESEPLCSSSGFKRIWNSCPPVGIVTLVGMSRQSRLICVPLFAFPRGLVIYSVVLRAASSWLNFCGMYLFLYNPEVYEGC